MPKLLLPFERRLRTFGGAKHPSPYIMFSVVRRSFDIRLCFGNIQFPLAERGRSDREEYFDVASENVGLCRLHTPLRFAQDDSTYRGLWYGGFFGLPKALPSGELSAKLTERAYERCDNVTFSRRPVGGDIRPRSARIARLNGICKHSAVR